MPAPSSSSANVTAAAADASSMMQQSSASLSLEQAVLGGGGVGPGPGRGGGRGGRHPGGGSSNNAAHLPPLPSSPSSSPLSPSPPPASPQSPPPQQPPLDGDDEHDYGPVQRSRRQRRTPRTAHDGDIDGNTGGGGGGADQLKSSAVLLADLESQLLDLGGSGHARRWADDVTEEAREEAEAAAAIAAGQAAAAMATLEDVETSSSSSRKKGGNSRRPSDGSSLRSGRQHRPRKGGDGGGSGGAGGGRSNHHHHHRQQHRDHHHHPPRAPPSATYRSEALEGLADAVRDARYSLDDEYAARLDDDENGGGMGGRKTVRSILRDGAAVPDGDGDGGDGDGADGKKNANDGGVGGRGVGGGGEPGGHLTTNAANPCQAALASYSDLTTSLLRLSDELDLRSKFQNASAASSSGVVDFDAVGKLLERAPDLDAAFANVRQALFDLYDDASDDDEEEEEEEDDEEEGASAASSAKGVESPGSGGDREVKGLLRTTSTLIRCLSTTTKRVHERMEYGPDAECAFVTLLELVRNQSVELKAMHEKASAELEAAMMGGLHGGMMEPLEDRERGDDGDFDGKSAMGSTTATERAMPGPLVQRAWTNAGHGDVVRALEKAAAKDDKANKKDDPSVGDEHGKRSSSSIKGPKKKGGGDDGRFVKAALRVLSDVDEWVPDLIELESALLGRKDGTADGGTSTKEGGVVVDETNKGGAVAQAGMATSSKEDEEEQAAIPDAARDALSKIRGGPLPRESTVSKVARKLMADEEGGGIGGKTPNFHGSFMQSSNTSSQLQLNGSSTLSFMSVLPAGRSVAVSSISTTTGGGSNDGGAGAKTDHDEGQEDEDEAAAEGMGGVGKTTIAALLCHRSDVRRHYHGGIAWLNVGNRGESGFGYDLYCAFLRSICQQIGIDPDDDLHLEEWTGVPGEHDAVRDRKESQLMSDARDAVAALLQPRGSVLIVLDDVWRDADVDWFRFRRHKKTVNDLLLTTRVRDLCVSDTVEVDLLREEESLRLLMSESDQPPDHPMAGSAEARAIVVECAHHPLAVKTVGRWLALKHATAGVINSVEEIHEDVARSIERISGGSGIGGGAAAIPGNEEGGEGNGEENGSSSSNMLYEIMNQSFSPTVNGKPTKVIKLCYAAFVRVFCREEVFPPAIPMETADELFDKLLQHEDSRLFQEDTLFQSHRRDATLLIPEALGALGVFSITKEEDARTPGRVQRTLRIDHEIQQEYGEYLCDEDPGMKVFMDDAERKWNRAYVTSYHELKEEYYWDDDQPDLAREYALRMMPAHMLRAEMFEDMAALLRDEGFVRGRLWSMGWVEGINLHVRDCEGLCRALKQVSSARRLGPQDVLARSYEKVAEVLKKEIVGESNGPRGRCPPLDAARGLNGMGYSLAEKKCWSDAIIHYTASKQLLLVQLGDAEQVASLFYIIGTIFFETNEHEKALEALEECLRIREKNLGKDHVLYARALYKAGDVLSGMSDYSAAFERYERSFKTLDLEPNKNRLDIGNVLHSKGRIYYCRGQLDEAMKCYEKSLRYKKIELGLHHSDLALIYEHMADIFAEKGNAASAAPLYEEAIRVHKLTAPFGDENRADILCIEGVLHMLMGEDNKSLQCYENSLHILKANLGHKKEKIASLLNVVGCEYAKREEYKKAMKLYEESLHARRNMLGFVHLDVATTLFNMSYVHQKRDKHEKALKCLEEALRIRKMRLGDNEKVAITLEQIGSVAKIVGQHKKAELAYEEALRMRRLLHGDDHENVAGVLHEMGDLMDDIGEYDEAMNLFIECLDIRKKRLGGQHEDVAATLYAMGFTKHNQGHYDKALLCFEEALETRKNLFGEEHPSVGDTYNMMGFVEAKRGELDESLRLLWEALRIRKQTGENIKASETLKNIGNVHREQQQFELAVECYEDCLRIRRAALGNDHEKVADALIALGNVRSDNSLHKDAMDTYQEALQIRILAYGENDDRVSQVLQNMGIMEFRAGNLDKGKQFLEEFARIRRYNRTDKNASFTNVLFIIGNIHKLQGDSEGAKRVWMEAYEIFSALGLESENPEIAEVLENLLSDDNNGNGKKRSVIGKVKTGLSEEKLKKKGQTKKPLKVVQVG